MVFPLYLHLPSPILLGGRHQSCTSPCSSSSLAYATRSVNAKEQKQILADIERGSKLFGRKFLDRKPSQKRGQSSDNITPVTVLSPEPQTEQEERRGRKSTNSQRPGLPKRTSSMKRAYNYFFGSAPAQQPMSPTSPVTTEAVKASQQDGKNGSRDAGVDTPPQTPAQEAHPTVPEEGEPAEPAEPASKCNSRPPLNTPICNANTSLS